MADNLNLRTNDDGTVATIYLAKPRDVTFMKELRSLVEVAVVKRGGSHVKVVIEPNPLYSEEQLVAALTPLVDRLVTRQSELQAYTPKYRFIYWSGNDKLDYSLYLQTEADEQLLADIENDPATRTVKYFADERRLYVARFAAFADGEYVKRVHRYASQFLARSQG